MEEKTNDYQRYGILVNDDEWKLLYKSVVYYRDNVNKITGESPDDLTKLMDDLHTIKSKGYLTINNGNQVSEEELKDRFLCDTCE